MSNSVQEARFDYKGYPCVVLFMMHGYRCGYVGLPHGHRYYKERYDNIPVNCHGGLTYSRSTLHGQEDDNRWWIGFDCGHCNDGYDVEKIEEYYADDKFVMTLMEMNRMTGVYKIYNIYEARTLEYCIEQCKSIVDQLEG